jgi:diamine N-acetyltransferase
MSYFSDEHVILRAPELSDLEHLYKWENDTDLWCTGTNRVSISRYVLERYLETAHLDIYEAKQLRLMICATANPEKPIGAIDLFEFEPYDSRAGVGVLIANPEDRQQKYASSALTLLKKYAFNVLGIHQLYCHVASDNEASLALFSKFGFEKVGLLKQWSRWENGFVDQYILQCINSNQNL